MYKYLNLLAAGIIGSSVLFIALIGPVRSQQPEKEESLAQRLARSTELSEQNVEKLLSALGPAIREDLQRGKQVTIPGLGVFRLVRVAEHRELKNGRPVFVPTTNTIEFSANGEAANSVNVPEATPGETVPITHQTVLPGQTPGQKVPRTRVPSTRVR